jgi:hypothetical protein
MKTISNLTNQVPTLQAQSSVELEKVNVYAYLSPHPYDEDGYFEAEWVEDLPGYKKDCEDTPLLDEHNSELFKTITTKVETEFREALAFLWPLVGSLEIQSLQICVDITGVMLSANAAGSYFYGRSDAKKGKYVFIASRGLVFKYLKSIQNGDQVLSQHLKELWQHEIIHMLDHDNIIKTDMLSKLESISKIVKKYLLGYRIEGVADLLDLLKGHSKISSMEEAKQSLRNELEKVSSVIAAHDKSPLQNLKKEIFSSDACYDLGPWLIVDYLLQSSKPEVVELAQDCLDRTISKIPIGHSDMLQMVKYSLEISNRDFIKYLESQKITVDSIIASVISQDAIKN